MDYMSNITIQFCCDMMKDALEGPLNSVHISELAQDKEISPFYMNVETTMGVKPAFLKYCPDCGTRLSDHKW